VPEVPVSVSCGLMLFMKLLRISQSILAKSSDKISMKRSLGFREKKALFK